MCFPLVHRADLEGAPKSRRQTIIPFDRDTPWSTHGAGCLDKVKTVLVETLTKPMRKNWPS
jgi:hypothetical protein